MCIVIDTNCFASVFDADSQRHLEFKPVREWIISGRGKLVYGGTTYRGELTRAKKYLRLFTELKKAAKVVEVDSQQVDRIEQELRRRLSHPDFDDPHLVAIVIASGCRLICSDDVRAFPFLRQATLYPKHVQRPHIYSQASNKDLLQDKNIADICKPLIRLPKASAPSAWPESK